jgi:hypothetical protein
MTDDTYTSDGPYDVTSDEFVEALDRADRATERADRERAAKRERPGFFVAPDDHLPDL